jgi:hypothetical protein
MKEMAKRASWRKAGFAKTMAAALSSKSYQRRSWWRSWRREMAAAGISGNQRIAKK